MISPARLEALDLAKELSPTPSNLNRVAKNVGDESARWAFSQWELRKRGRAKFARADEMLFTREALEQATHEAVAAYHASLFPQGISRGDLTVGIGADLIALSPASGFELDEERAAYARHNLSVYGKNSSVVVADSLEAVWEFDCAFADPARRVEGRRTLNIHEFSPDPVYVARRMAQLELGVIKLTPMLPDSILEALGEALEFISFGGECREALVITGKRVVPGRWAVHVESGERLRVSEPTVGAVTTPARYLYEADPAAIRAHALPTLEQQYQLKPLGDSNGYLTSDEAIDSVWLKRYEVLYSGKADPSTTKRELQRIGAAKPILKQRGANQDLTKLAHAFKPQGSAQVALIIWPVEKSLRHTIVAIP